MSEAKQTERKEIGRIKLSDNQDLIASVVDNKKFKLSIADKVDNKKLELSIVDKGCNELKKRAEKWCNFCRSGIVYLIVVATLFAINCIAWYIWQVCCLWWLLPTAILGVGLEVQFLDAYLSVWWPKCVVRVYEKLKDKKDKAKQDKKP